MMRRPSISISGACELLISRRCRSSEAARSAFNCFAKRSCITTIELRREPIENHKMKTRCLDHIDLRVKDMQVARNFYGKFLPQLGFVRERHEPSPHQKAPGEDFHTFYSAG